MADSPDKNKLGVLSISKEVQEAEGIRFAVERYLEDETLSGIESRSQRALASLKEVLDALRRVGSPKDLEKSLARRLMEQHPNDIKLIKPCGKSYIRMYLAILKEIRDIQESFDEQEQTFFYKMGGKKPISELIASLEEILSSKLV